MRLNIRLDLNSERVRDRLLQGLDQWVQLGLLTDEEVRAFARTLSEAVSFEPIEEPAPRSVTPAVQPESSAAEPVAAIEPRENKLARAFRGLLEEFSVVWLLFLGVFLVVVSSAVLAASQWQSFSSVGQYAILLGYTLLFWVASIQAGKRENLQATARMLSLTTLLLTPINFWMMDALRVANSAVGIAVAGAAALLLSWIALKQLREVSSQTRIVANLSRVNLLILAWLHVGWSVMLWPVAATYIGVVGTTFNLTYQERSHADIEDDSSAPLLSFDGLAIALSTLILLFRSLFVVQVPPQLLGLAIGICGWLLIRLNRDRERKPELWNLGGGALLFTGWLICAEQPIPWQAIAIGLLTFSLLWHSFKRHWQPVQLFSILGLSAYIYRLLGGLIPQGTRASVLNTLAARVSSQPIADYEWLSLTFLPFLIGILFFASGLKRREKTALATLTEWTALVLGTFLTVIGSGNSFTLALNLVVSAGILLFVLKRRVSSIELVTLTHLVGLSAFASSVYYFLPDIEVRNWASIAIVSLVVEFAIHIRTREPDWKLSTWQVGVGLMPLCFWLLAYRTYSSNPAVAWFFVPITLTVVARHKHSLKQKETAVLSLVSLFAHTYWLFFVSGWATAIASFAIGTLCAIASTTVLRTKLAAIFTVGSGLMLSALSLLWIYIEVLPNSSSMQLHLYWPLVIWGLWLWRRRLERRTGDLSMIYQSAAMSWSLLMLALMFAYGAFVSVALIDSPDLLNWLGIDTQSYVIASFALLVAAIAENIRYRPAEWRYWSLSVASEIFVVLVLVNAQVGIKGIAIATLSLGLFALLASDLWTLKHPPYRDSWHGIPIAFAILGAIIGHSTFEADTGLFSIFAGIIALGVGRRQSLLNPWSYVGLAAFSIGAYEILIYQMSQASGGQQGDGFTLMALLGVAIALLQKFSSPYLLRYLKVPAESLQRSAHIHWLISTLLVGMAALSGLSQPTGIALWTLAGSLIAAYALAAGNNKLTRENVFFTHVAWTSIGIAQALLIVVHNRLIWFPDRMFIVNWGGVVACLLSLVLLRINWQKLGWPPQPWQFLTLWLPLASLTVAISHTVPNQTLLVVSAFYAWIAKSRNQIRFSYISVVLIDWALLRFLNAQGWLTVLPLSIVVGLSTLYLAELEPELQSPTAHLSRYGMRILASGLIGFAALYQAEIYTPHLGYAAITLAIATTFVFAGRFLDRKAFIHVGAITFVLQSFRIVGFVWLLNETFLIHWGGLLACLISFILLRINWQWLYLSPKPWEWLALSLPLSSLLVAIDHTVPLQTLLIIGAFYAWIAKSRGQVRLSYISVVLLDWALLRYLNAQNWLTPLPLSIVAGLTLLYLTEIEPSLQGTSARQQRHWLRILASGMISLAALYQTEIYEPTLIYAAITLVLATVLIFLGLGLKVRAPLYVGTTTFVLQVLRVLWLLISVNSLMLWVVGIVLGLLFIWVAATFESRRSQVTARLDAWTSALDDWE